jgi:hypothetical protein
LLLSKKLVFFIVLVINYAMKERFSIGDRAMWFVGFTEPISPAGGEPIVDQVVPDSRRFKELLFNLSITRSEEDENQDTSAI